MFSILMEKLVSEYKVDPRNKIFLGEDILLAAAREETGNDGLSSDQLRSVITNYLNGDLDGDQESIYDGAVYACGYAARHCFAEDPDEDVDYEIDWIEAEDGTYTAEVRAN